MIDRYLVRYFLAVIDQGNFSKAAVACHVSQPTLSVGIAKLEDLLGRPLFARTNRRVELTPAGAHLLEHARRIEASFAAAERDVRTTAQIDTIRVGLLATTPLAWGAHLIGIARSAIEGLRMEIVEGRERDLVEHLDRGRIDAALTILRPSGRLDGEPVTSEGYSLALAEGHPLAGHASVAAEALRDETMIVRQNCELLSETSRHFTARGIRPFLAARTTSEARALAYVRDGLGVTVMPDGIVGPGVVRLRLEGFPFRRDIGLLYAPHADRSFVARALPVDALRAAIGRAG